MSGEFWIAVAAVGVFFAGSLLYVVLMVFFPEWVGIAGKSKGKPDEGPDFFDRLQRTPAKPKRSSSQEKKTES